MTQLRDFIEKQRRGLQQKAHPIEQRRKALQAELQQLDDQMAVIQREWEELEKAQHAIGKPKPEPHGSITIKDAILLILKDEPRGMEASAILNELNRRWNVSIERTSFSPQMSRLKNKDRKVIQKGKLYFLKREGPT